MQFPGMNILSALKTIGTITKVAKYLRKHPDKTDVVMNDVAARVAKMSGLPYDPSADPDTNIAAFNQFVEDKGCSAEVKQYTSNILTLIKRIKDEGASAFSPDDIIRELSKALPIVGDLSSYLEGASMMAEMFSNTAQKAFTDAEVIDDYQAGDIDKL